MQFGATKVSSSAETAGLWLVCIVKNRHVFVTFASNIKHKKLGDVCHSLVSGSNEMKELFLFQQ